VLFRSFLLGLSGEQESSRQLPTEGDLLALVAQTSRPA
jgi:hypothetical protein